MDLHMAVVRSPERPTDTESDGSTQNIQEQQEPVNASVNEMTNDLSEARACVHLPGRLPDYNVVDTH